MAEEKELADSFCGFVEWRMRLQIIFDIDKKGGSIETHLNPNVYRETCDLPSKLVQTTAFRPIFCKVWLLAIVNDSVMPEQLNVMANQFDVTIKKQFINMKHKEILAPKLALKSILMKREKLLELDGA
uniref:FSA_C domain-containing protein n=1 Tax=Globodera pallida TaxID=36090 RepID=A0A183C885_GLOPA